MAVDHREHELPPHNEFLGIEIQEITGKRENTIRYYCDGFFYHSDSRNHLILRCSRRSTLWCPGLIKLNEDGDIEEMVPHDGYLRDDLLVQKELFRQEVFRRCRTTFETYTNIFNSVSQE